MRIKTKFVTSIFISIVLVSCSTKQKDEKEYYPSGNLKLEKLFANDDELTKTIEYYDESGSKILRVLFHKRDYDSVVYKYNNGKVFKTGKQYKNGDFFGKWNYYTREGYLSNTREFIIANNSFDKGVRLNQVWFFNQKGDTIYYGNNTFNVFNQKEFEKESKGEKTSIFVRFFYQPKGDTISIAEPLSCIAEDGFPLWEKRNSESYVVLAKEKYNFNKDFSNESEVKLDTFYCLEKDKENRGTLPDANQKHTVIFGRWFDTPGKKVLRGYMVEHYKRKATPNDSITGEKRRTYFEKIIYVKDTIRS